MLHEDLKCCIHCKAFKTCPCRWCIGNVETDCWCPFRARLPPTGRPRYAHLGRRRAHALRQVPGAELHAARRQHCRRRQEGARQVGQGGDAPYKKGPQRLACVVEEEKKGEESKTVMSFFPQRNRWPRLT